MTALAHRSTLRRPANGGVAARRAVIRWALRMFRREWRQQILVIALLSAAGVLRRQFCPSKDLTTATCVWEADSVDSVREYVDSTLGDSSDNTYFEIDSKHAQGLPEPATTRA